MTRRFAALAAVVVVGVAAVTELTPWSTNGSSSADGETYQITCTRDGDALECAGVVVAGTTTSSTVELSLPGPASSTTVAETTPPTTEATTTSSSSSTTTSSTTTTTPASTTTVPAPNTYTVGAGDSALRLAAPTGAATMTVAQLAAAGGSITGPTIIRGGTYAGRVTITGNDVVITGVTFTGAQSDLIRITGNATRVRLYRNTFTNAGSNAGAGSFGLIKVDPHPSVTDNAAAQRVAIDRRLTIDENTFTNPRNAVMWVNHGNRRIRFSHNTITGPAFTPTGDSESEAIKFGWNDGVSDDATGSVFAFNTITNYDGRPYTVGFKQSGWQIVGNILARRTELRSANNIRFVGNVIADGDLQGGGTGHTVAKNFIRTLVDRDSFGPLMLYTTNNSGFYVVWKGGTFTGNTIINDSSSDGYGVLLFHSQFSGVTERPNGNTFTDNLFVSKLPSGRIGSGWIMRNNNDSQSTAQVMAANTWTNNRWASATAAQGTPPGGTQIAVPPSTVPTTVILTTAELPGTV